MQTASASQGSTIVQIVGDGNTVVQGQPHLQLTRYFSRRQVRNDLDRLSPYTRSTRLIGREREMESLRAFLEDPRSILARVITGGGGRGKTRLGLEVCEWANEQGWSAGFAGRSEMTRFLAQQNLSTWGWQRPTLIVIDYAAQHAQSLAPWIEELADRDDEPSQPLRLLLLERNASMEVGWCANVFSSGGFGDTSKRALLDPPEPVELAPLQTSESRLALMEDLLRQVAPDRQSWLSSEHSPLAELRRHDAGGDPLYLMMAALSSEAQGGGAHGALKRTELALELARREAKRICELAVGQHVDPHLAVHLVACVTLAQGMERHAFQAFAAAEKGAVQRPSGGDAAVLADLLQQALPRTHGIAPVLPDLIGEAFIVLSGIGTEALLRCYAKRGVAVVRTVIRCAQDFSPQRAEPLEWLSAIEETIADDEGALDAVAAVLPSESVALADISLSIARRLAAHRSGKQVPAERRAAALENLASAYAHAGQRERALQPAEEAVELYRTLARHRSEKHRAELARSLSNLAIGLSELGQREPALKAAEEAAQLYRKLATRHPDDFRPALAASLNNLAITLSDLDRREPALHAAQEAASLYRELVARRPEGFQAALAGSLNNMASRLSDLNQREAALAAAQEAADIRRELATQRPDVFRPALAGSLSDLAGMLSDLKQHEAALQAAQEAADMHRELAAVRPDLFRPDLAMSLSTLAVMLTELHEHGPAVHAAEEAAEMYRQLATIRPAAYEPDLTRSLAVLAHCRKRAEASGGHDHKARRTSSRTRSHLP
jgi:hypothetical protein